MKLIPVFILFVFCLENASAQSGIWTWMSGDSTYNNSGYDVDLGIADSLNKPGATYAPCYWKDTAGNFWMFGGTLITSYGHYESTNNDLWMFNPNTNLWTLVSSGGGDYNFGRLRVSKKSNYPPARFGAASWIDKNGDLWLFGGKAYYDFMNDVWKYNIRTNIWTWMGGSDSLNELSIYGVRGVPDSSNRPSARQFCNVWLDKNNDVWIFGGNGGEEGNVYHNDLWKYQPDSNIWTWVSGANFDKGTPAGYWGTLGVPTLFTIPRGRDCDCHWQDSSGNFYLFGGYSYGAGFDGYFNDIWKYSLSNNEWTWIAGDDSLNYYDEKSILCSPSIKNSSASRDQPDCWLNKDGTFGFFGGLVECTKVNISVTSDVWNFNPLTLEWTRLDGLGNAYLLPHYGIVRIPDEKNQIGPREGAAQWIDKQNDIWIFGGEANYYKTNNDMWKYTPDSSCFTITSVAPVQNKFTVYPNPVHDELTVSFPFSNNIITISDLFGRVLNQFKVESGSSKTINISFPQAGVYLLSIEGENGNLIASAKLFKE